MKFDNAQFKSGVKSTLDDLRALRQGLNLKDVEKESSKFNLAPIGDAVQKVAPKFGLMAVAGATAIAKLTSSAIDGGIKMARGLVDPIVEGGKRRAQNLEQANTLFEGLGVTGKKLVKVQDAINNSVTGTAYSYDVAAKLGASFIASNVPISKVEGALKATAGMAAVTSSSMEEIGDIMGNVAGQGRLMGSDLNRLSTRGLNAAATLAKGYKKAGNTALDTEAEVRKAVSKGQISFQDFAKAMDSAFSDQAFKANETYTGALSNMRSALARIGVEFAISNFERLRRSALAAKDLFSTFKGTLGPVEKAFDGLSKSGAKRTEEVLGAITQVVGAKKFSQGMKAIGDGMNNLRSNAYQSVKPIHAAYKAIFQGGEGGAKGAANAEKNFNKLARPFKALALIFRDVTKAFKPSKETQKRIQQFAEGALKGLLAFADGSANAMEGFRKKILPVLSAVGKGFSTAVGWIVTGVGFILGALGKLGSGAGVGLTWLTDQFKKLGQVFAPLGHGFQNLWASIAGGGKIDLSSIGESIKGIGTALAGGISGKAKDIWSSLKQAFSGDYSGITGELSGIGDSFTKMTADMGGSWTDAMNSIKSVAESVSSGITKMFDGMGSGASAGAGVVKTLWDGLKWIGNAMKPLLTGFSTGLGNIFGNLDWDKLLAGMNFAMLISAFQAIREVVKPVKDVGNAFAGMADSIGGTAESVQAGIEAYTSTLKTMQTDLKANILIKIAAAILLLAAALYVLTKVDAATLGPATAAMGALIAVIVSAMVPLANLAKNPVSLASLGVIAQSMVGMAAAVLVLAFAAQKLGTLKMGDLAKGMGAVIILLAALTGIAAIMAKHAIGMPAAALGLNAMAAAIAALIIPVVTLSMIPYEMLKVGMDAVLLLLFGLVVAAALLNEYAPSMALSALGLMAMAAALNMLMIPILVLGAIPSEILGQGIAAVAMALGLLVGAAVLLNKYAPEMVLSALGLLAMVAALNLMLIPILVLGSIGWETLIQGLLGTAAVMAILVIAAQKMTTAAVGAGAMIVVALAILVLAVAVRIMAAIPWQAAAIGLGILVVGLLAIVGVGALAGLAAAGLLVLAAACLAIGVAFILGAVGAMILAVALPGLILAIMALGTQWQAMLAGVAVLAALGAGFLVFGAGAMVAGAAAMILGLGLVLMGVGFMMLMTTGMAGAAVMTAVAKAAADLIWVAPQIGIVGAAFLVLGAGLVLVGAGLIVTAAGLVAFAIGLVLFLGAGMLAKAFIEAFIPTLTSLGTVAPLVQISAMALGALALAMSQIHNQGTNAASALTSLTNSLIMLVSALVLASQSVGTAKDSVVSSIDAIALAMTSSAPKIQSANNTINTAFLQLAILLSLSGKVIALAAATAIKMVVTTISKGAPQVSKGTKEIASAFAGLAIALVKAGVTIAFAATAAINNLKSIINDGLYGVQITVGGSAYAIGANIASGLASGIRNNQSGAINAAKSLATSAIKAAKSELDIQSPSKKFAEIGKFVVKGFVQGVVNERKSIKKTFSDLKNDIKSLYESSAKDIDKYQRQIARLEKKKKKTSQDQKDLKLAKERLKVAKKERLDAKAILNMWKSDIGQVKTAKGLVTVTKLRADLLAFGKDWERITKDLAKAEEKLKDAKRIRDDYNKSVKESLESLPAFDKVPERYNAILKKQVDDTKKFNEQMEILRKRGLNDALYKKLIDQGLDALPYINNLVAAGKTGVAEVNKLQKSLETVAKASAKNASSNLYQAGVDTAQGVVDGLKKQLKTVEKQMTALANAMVKALKRELGIKSPSRVTAKIGEQTVAGLVNSLKAGTREVSRVSGALGSTTADALAEAIMFSAETLNANPVITPEVDLSKVLASASDLAAIFGGESIGARITGIQKSRRAITQPDGASGANVQGSTIQYIQNNNSPKALSYAELYRQTKNLISTRGKVNA